MENISDGSYDDDLLHGLTPTSHGTLVYCCLAYRKGGYLDLKVLCPKGPYFVFNFEWTPYIIEFIKIKINNYQFMCVI